LPQGYWNRIWFACTAAEINSLIDWFPGSTVPYVVERIVAQGRELNKDRVFIPTGFQSKELIVMSNLNLGDIDQFSTIDVTIDGADE